jgi:hypothetical protein
MGDNLLRQQISNFKRRRDRARTEADTPKLYERTEIVETIYEATPNNGDSFKPNDVLYAMPDGDDAITLVKGHRKVATINGDAGKAFRDALAEPDTSGVAEVRVTSVSDISGTISVQIKTD